MSSLILYSAKNVEILRNKQGVFVPNTAIFSSYSVIVRVSVVLKRNIYRPTEADATNRNPTPVTTVTIPYIKGTSETISRILQRKTETNLTTDREQFTRSNAPTARLPTLVRLAETLTRD